MMTRTLLARCAPLAIAASAALPSIPAIAQDGAIAEPVIVLPEPVPVPVDAPSAAPSPAIVLPEPAAEPAPVAATPQAEPVRARTPAAATAQPSASRPVATRATGSAPIERTVVPAAETQASVSAAAVAPALPTEAGPVADEPVAVVANDNATSEIALASLLGAAGLGAVGAVAYAASRRRRRRALDNELDPEGLAREPVNAGQTVEPTPALVGVGPAPVAAAFAAPVAAKPSPAPKTALASGDPIALPAEVPETFEERDALLKELVAAEPDKANPFTSPKARARRAKLIIQSLARDFTSRKPRIDLSEYTNRWPALRGWHPATA